MCHPEAWVGCHEKVSQTADNGGSGVHEGLLQGRYLIPEGGVRDVDAKSEGGYGGGKVEGEKGEDGGRDDSDGRGSQ